MKQNEFSRYPRAYVSSLTTNHLRVRNPYLVATWAAFAPGLGNLLQQRIGKGLLLVIWGAVVNLAAHINLALWYSLTGHFELARNTVNTRWLLLYVAVYVYAVWDAYRGTVEMNRLGILADREDAPVKPFVIQQMDINYLDKRSPGLAATWSALGSGLGSLYLHKIFSGIFFIVWTITVFYFSHVLQAIHLTLTGDFEAAKAVVDMQWLLFIPCTYVFGIYDAYVSAVESNALFLKEQSKWLRDDYQQLVFPMPL